MIINYHYEKNPINSEDDSGYNGEMAAVLDFRSTVLPISYVHRYSPGDATVAGLGGALSQNAFTGDNEVAS